MTIAKLRKKIARRLIKFYWIIVDDLISALYTPRLSGFKEMKYRHKNTRFRIFIKRRDVFKVLSLRRLFGIHLFKCLVDNDEFNTYKRILESLESLEFLGKHISKLRKVYRTGSYSGSYHAGYNLYMLNIKEIYPNKDLLTDQRIIADIKVAVVELIGALEKYQCKYQTITGDWNLQNLIYDIELKRIVNVDLEGFYSYRKGAKFSMFLDIYDGFYSIKEKLEGLLVDLKTNV